MRNRCEAGFSNVLLLVCCGFWDFKKDIPLQAPLLKFRRSVGVSDGLGQYCLCHPPFRLKPQTMPPVELSLGLKGLFAWKLTKMPILISKKDGSYEMSFVEFPKGSSGSLLKVKGDDELMN